jgi:GntR family histidine utilization transcriptional repressor
VKPLSLERRIRADLEANIRSGGWPPGTRLPTEQALVAQYGCARMTVNKAIGALVGAGLVRRNKKAGTVVASPRVQTAVLEIPDIGALIAARGESYEFRLLSRRVRARIAEDDDAGGFAAAGKRLALKGLHIAGGAPFALEDRLISLVAVPQAEQVDFSHEAPGSWLLENVPWTAARHRISAASAASATAKALNVPLRSACLSVERWTFRLNEGVTFVRQTFPGDRYSLVADLSPGVSSV